MTTTPAHSKLPWRLIEADKKSMAKIVDADGAKVLSFTSLDRANAEFILARANQPAPLQSVTPDRVRELVQKSLDSHFAWGRTEGSPWAKAHAKISETSLNAAIDQMADYAENYRYLRDDAMYGSRHDPAVLKDGPRDDCEYAFGDELDALVDAARAAQPVQEG